MRTTRSLTSALLAVGLVPAVLALPVVTAPHHAAHPVSGRFTSAALRGVDAAAESALDADVRRGQRRTGALDPALGRPEVLTAKRTTSTFSTIGVTWAHGSTAAPVVNVRVRQQGRWTTWETLALSDVGPDASSDEARTARNGTEPLLTDPSDAYQVRVDTSDGRLPADIRVDVIDPGTSAADADLQPSSPAASAQAQASTPTIISRRQWGADESIRQCCPKYMSTIRAGFVHHTASSNTYTASGAAAQVRAIYLYHVKANGWSDIGYNFLVDKFGRIFEGRYGGVTSAVKGAHTGGFNQDTFGVAALGTYSSSAPSVMVSSIARVFAWKFDLNRRNPYATATLTSEGGGTSRYPAGKQVVFNNISGHRNAGYTECPGNYLYAQLGKIRALAKSYLGPAFYTPSQSAFAGTYGSSLGPLVSTYVSQGMTVHFTVTDRCSGVVVRSYSGYTTTRYAPRWDLKTATGAWARPGYYTLTLSSSGVRTWTSGYEVLPGAGTPLSACPTQRISGPDVAETSVVAARASAPSAKTVVLALGSSRDLISGLIAAPLARSLDGVLLMTDTLALPPSVRADVIRRGATTAYIVGPESSVGAGVVTELRSLGVQTVRRLVGVDRYDTAAVVARAMPRHATGAVIVSGLDAYLADGFAAAGPAAALGQPILLASSTVPATTSSALHDLGITSTAVVAPVAGVSEAARAALPSPTRFTASTRPAAAVAVANAYASRVGVSRVSVVSLASASVMPYALIAGAAGALTLVTTPTALSAEVGTWVRAHAVTSAGIFGPQAALSPAVLVALAPAVSA